MSIPQQKKKKLVKKYAITKINTKDAGLKLLFMLRYFLEVSWTAVTGSFDAIK